MGYAIMIMAWSSGSLWIAGSDKISGYCERSEKRVTVNGVNSNEKFKNCMKSSRVRLTSLSYSVIGSMTGIKTDRSKESTLQLSVFGLYCIGAF